MISWLRNRLGALILTLTHPAIIGPYQRKTTTHNITDWLFLDPQREIPYSPSLRKEVLILLSLWTIWASEVATLPMQLKRIQKKVLVIRACPSVIHGRDPCLSSVLDSSMIPDAQDMPK